MKFALKFLMALLVLMTSLEVLAKETDVSCIYETTKQQISRHKQGHNHQSGVPETDKWYFWRTDNVIEVANADRNFGEKWTKTKLQSVFYQMLYHDKKF